MIKQYSSPPPEFPGMEICHASPFPPAARSRTHCPAPDRRRLTPPQGRQGGPFAFTGRQTCSQSTYEDEGRARESQVIAFSKGIEHESLLREGLVLNIGIY